ncbi:lytic transglycosylase domain-containing protein [Sphingomonas sp. S-NIH.Pt15_0812]|uniref:lytic transglycosylase domain-containing protein n=1 Tax=Sphingomonas sp. S-NIH.Pt15_0812 TaxID=1920129 RepID=UPI000F7F61C8|nr:lytic transglycosylase domain-containing protein [Sphingomonas sp. S-NIH.Pt15_0812]RSU47382.1 lytic transglycosylase domain-containing protein [Sphingomonas sp. S-NIH.Pt15_0812]
MSVHPVQSGRIQQAIAYAANATGIDFDYLLGQAKVESGLNASARAGSSSASGLYQFIESSWLAVVKKHGAEHGLGWAADAIGTSGGRYSVADGATRQAILALRNDPAAASLMAAEHASDNKAALEGNLGRAASGTDLYMAHFLGLGGANKFLSAMRADPQASGASLFPGAARTNRSVFYDDGGRPRSLSAIYQRFADKLGAGGDSVGETRGANLAFAAQALAMGDDTTVVTGANETADSALTWARSTLGQLNGKRAAAGDSLLRPRPDHARLAYMMLARMGG